MNEIAEKEFAGEIYLAVNRLNELILTAAAQHRMRTDIKVQSIERIGVTQHDRVTVSVYREIER